MLLQLTLYNVRTYICTHTYTQDLVHYIFNFFQLDNASTHPPSLLPASFCHTFIIKKPLNYQDTKRHLANKINRRPFCRSYLKRLFAPSCPSDSIINIGRKKALEIRAAKRSSVDFVGKMPFCVLVVERLFNYKGVAKACRK